MVLRTKIEPIAKAIDLLVANTLSPKAQKEAVASFARGAIAEADATNRRVLGRVPARTITVDGREGAPLTDVRPDGGSIIVEYELINDVLIWIGETLRQRSPVISGKYRDSWTLLADGTEVSREETVPVADTYTFVNDVPYARKIEVGLTESGRPFVIQVPNRIAERTAKDAAQRFGNVAKIKSTFIGLQNAYVLKTPGSSRSRGRRKKTRVGAVLTYPAIEVSMRL